MTCAFPIVDVSSCFGIQRSSVTKSSPLTLAMSLVFMGEGWMILKTGDHIEEAVVTNNDTAPMIADLKDLEKEDLNTLRICF